MSRPILLFMVCFALFWSTYADCNGYWTVKLANPGQCSMACYSAGKPISTLYTNGCCSCGDAGCPTPIPCNCPICGHNEPVTDENLDVLIQSLVELEGVDWNNVMKAAETVKALEPYLSELGVEGELMH